MAARKFPVLVQMNSMQQSDLIPITIQSNNQIKQPRNLHRIDYLVVLELSSSLEFDFILERSGHLNLAFQTKM